MTVEMTWTAEIGGEKQEICVQMTENSFRKAMDILDKASEDAFIQINDPRFTGGKAIFLKKRNICGWICPETSLLKYQNKEERE